MADFDLDMAERLGVSGESELHRTVRMLASEVRSLQHQLADPNFMYAGSRIHRQAVLSRNADIDRHLSTISALKEKAKGAAT